MAQPSSYIPAVPDIILPDQLPAYDTDAPAGHSSARQHGQLFLLTVHHQKAHLPESQFLHIYLNKMEQYLTL